MLSSTKFQWYFRIKFQLEINFYQRPHTIKTICHECAAIFRRSFAAAEKGKIVWIFSVNRNRSHRMIFIFISGAYSTPSYHDFLWESMHFSLHNYRQLFCFSLFQWKPENRSSRASYLNICIGSFKVSLTRGDFFLHEIHSLIDNFLSIFFSRTNMASIEIHKIRTKAITWNAMRDNWQYLRHFDNI